MEHQEYEKSTLLKLLEDKLFEGYAIVDGDDDHIIM